MSCDVLEKSYPKIHLPLIFPIYNMLTLFFLWYKAATLGTNWCCKCLVLVYLEFNLKCSIQLSPPFIVGCGDHLQRWDGGGCFWEWCRCITSGPSTSEGRYTWDPPQINTERPNWDRLGVSWGGRATILIEGCWGWNCQAGSPEEERREDLWMKGKTTWS